MIKVFCKKDITVSDDYSHITYEKGNFYDAKYENTQDISISYYIFHDGLDKTFPGRRFWIKRDDFIIIENEYFPNYFETVIESRKRKLKNLFYF